MQVDELVVNLVDKDNGPLDVSLIGSVVNDPAASEHDSVDVAGLFDFLVDDALDKQAAQDIPEIELSRIAESPCKSLPRTPSNKD